MRVLLPLCLMRGPGDLLPLCLLLLGGPGGLCLMEVRGGLLSLCLPPSRAAARLKQSKYVEALQDAQASLSIQPR